MRAECGTPLHPVGVLWRGAARAWLLCALAHRADIGERVHSRGEKAAYRHRLGLSVFCGQDCEWRSDLALSVLGA